MKEEFKIWLGRKWTSQIKCESYRIDKKVKYSLPCKPLPEPLTSNARFLAWRPPGTEFKQKQRRFCAAYLTLRELMCRRHWLHALTYSCSKVPYYSFDMPKEDAWPFWSFRKTVLSRSWFLAWLFLRHNVEEHDHYFLLRFPSFK